MCHILLKGDVNKNLNNFSETMKKISAAQFALPSLGPSELVFGSWSMSLTVWCALPSCRLSQKLRCHLAFLYLPSNQSTAAGSQILLDPSALV